MVTNCYVVRAAYYIRMWCLARRCKWGWHPCFRSSKPGKSWTADLSLVHDFSSLGVKSHAAYEGLLLKFVLRWAWSSNEIQFDGRLSPGGKDWSSRQIRFHPDCLNAGNHRSSGDITEQITYAAVPLEWPRDAAVRETWWDDSVPRFFFTTQDISQHPVAKIAPEEGQHRQPQLPYFPTDALCQTWSKAPIVWCHHAVLSVYSRCHQRSSRVVLAESILATAQHVALLQMPSQL